MAPQDVLDAFMRYVQNDIPLRLIFVPEMKLVDRFAVQEYYLPFIKEITESSVNQMLPSHTNRESAVMQLVKERVQYAILSHRWLPKGEPTFKEMIDGTVEDCGPGRDKLRKFCEVATNSGSKFAWSDTCCIDKSSSSELDEALRSMFRWYRNVERQPLLASSGNDKCDGNVLRLLSAATGCSEDNLRHFKPGPFYVDDRMAWAARRKTTRAEDMAYSLMGIFDVGLQPAYGEGGERAFCRLVEMVMQMHGNTSVLNWAGKPAASHSSLALPSSPRSYLGHRHFNSVRKLDLAMTGRGFRIPLLILPMKVHQIKELGDSIVRTEFCFSDARLREEVEVLSIDILGGRFSKDRHWALGVFNYMPPYGNQANGHPALRQLSTAYLLWRRVAPDQGQLEVREGFKVQDDLRFYGWKKASTATFVDFTLNTVGRKEVMIVNKELVEVVYL